MRRAARVDGPPPGFSFSIFVPGDPVTQGSKRLVGRMWGKPRMIEDRAKDLKAWREKVATLAMVAYRKALREDGQAPTVLIDGPVEVWATFYLRPPKRLTCFFPRTKPDGDKLMRAVGDALTGVVWTDDARVVDGHARKRYAGVIVRGQFAEYDESGVKITVMVME